MTRPTLKWLLLLLLVVVLFYWKIAFTSQFTVLAEYEAANQGYAWYHYALASLKHGTIPLWDPYTQSGRSFIGEMDTGVFYPLKPLLALFPFNRSGLFSPQLFQLFFIFVHFMAGCAMFFLVRDLGLGYFAALVSAACFGLGGLVGRVGWPDMLDSCVWLPVIVLFLWRALRSETVRRGLLFAALAGLALGLAILGGRLHVAMMDSLVVVSAAAFFAFCRPDRKTARAGFGWTAIVVAAVALVAAGSAAVQLLPSIEYSGRAVRYLSDALVLPAQQKIAYAHLSEGFWPRALLNLLFGFPFNGAIGATENYGVYFGVLPLLLAVIGAWKNWGNPLVRYLTGLAVLAFFYSMGAFSFLHGLLYSIVPFLWMAREASRFIYLTHFAMAVLAGFGVETLLSAATDPVSLAPLARACKWVVVGSLVGLGIPALYGKPEITDWVSLSVLFILAAYGLFLYILRGNRNRVAQFLVVALILCDLSAFNWTIRNKIEFAKAAQNQLDRLLRCRGVANFLKSRPGVFRVQMLGERQPNLGELFGVQTVLGMAATVIGDYERFLNTVPHSVDLLNVRYFVKPKTAPEPGAIYEDAAWKVYENPNCYPRAWLVRETAVEPVPDKLRARLGEPGFDPRRTALLAAPLPAVLEAKAGGVPDNVTFVSYEANRLELKVRAENSGLLLLSEVYYPGWRATVNGASAPIYKADGAFRAVLVPAGESTVVFRYRPASVLAGGILSLLVFIGVLLAAYIFRRELAAENADAARA